MRALILCLLFAPHIADACSRPYIPVFQLFDDASTVAHVRVEAIDGMKVTFHVEKAFKGTPGNRFTITTDGTTCDPDFKLGATGVVMTGQGEFFPKATKSLLAAMTAYSSAKTTAERAAVLVEQAIQKGAAMSVAYDAGLALANDPAALATVTDADRDR